jgi:Periplasmic binding protein
MGRRVLVLFAAFVLTACELGSSSEPAAGGSPVASPTSATSRVIGLIGTASGARSRWGEDAFEGADLAVHILNRELEEGEEPFELVTLDDRGDKARAQALIERLAADQRTVGIVYAGAPLGTKNAEAVLGDAGIPLLQCFGDPKFPGNHIFQVAPRWSWQASRIARYVAGDRGYQKVGVLAEKSNEGRGEVAALKQALEGRARVAVARYEPGRSLRGALKVLRAVGAEAVVTAVSSHTFGRVLEVLDESGWAYQGTSAATRASSVTSSGRRGEHWRPQVVGFDSAISEFTSAPPAGTAAADSYERGPHLLPLPTSRVFFKAYEDWWGESPLGWEYRGFDAAGLIGWAAARGSDEDLAEVLEGAKNLRLSGPEGGFGPHDHVFTHRRTVGLWVVPRARSLEPTTRLPDRLPWAPLARGFSAPGGKRTAIPKEDRWAFFGGDPSDYSDRERPPLVTRMRIGVATPRSDPVH